MCFLVKNCIFSVFFMRIREFWANFVKNYTRFYARDIQDSGLYECESGKRKSPKITVLNMIISTNAKSLIFLLRSASVHDYLCQWTGSSKIARIWPKIVRDHGFWPKIILFWTRRSLPMVRGGLQNPGFFRRVSARSVQGLANRWYGPPLHRPPVGCPTPAGWEVPENLPGVDRTPF